jgi:hypothetical protein
MTSGPAGLTLAGWDERRDRLMAAGLREPWYGGPLSRHAADGDRRLLRLRFDDSAAALRLWNFLLTEEERLRRRREEGHMLVGAMKDLGTVPVMAYSLPGVTAFYPDGAWWTPCLMEMDDGLLVIADSLGINEAFCPVRAMLGAFVNRCHFPIPDLLVCSAGAVCDDFSAIAQRLSRLGHQVLWWEVPNRRAPDPGEEAVELPGGLTAPRSMVGYVAAELGRVRDALSDLAGRPLDDAALSRGIAEANAIRRRLAALRDTVFTAASAPLPALEMQIAEMLAIHYCSDREETALVLDDLLAEARRRVGAGAGAPGPCAVRVFWVNPVADVRMMNVVEDCGGRVCGSEYLFSHALDRIPEDCPPLEALARSALADPMAGPAAGRAARVARDAARFGAEAVVVSRIPGASHCATEGAVIAGALREGAGLPTAEIEVPPVSDAAEPAIRGRIEALLETARARRRGRHDVRGD